MIDPERHIGYVRVSSFHHNTMRDFEAVLTEILHRGARGLVLDLRFNPGGLMDQAVAMVDRFVNHGMIVSTVTRRKAVHEYPAARRSISPEVRLAVLINDASASASEIVAGALQAHERAVIVGSRSFGKGSVQHLIHLDSNGAAIKLTAAYYRLPNGRIIHRTHYNEHTDSWGVQPDVLILLDDEEVTAIQQSRRALDTAFTESSEPSVRQESGGADDAQLRPRTLQIIRDRQLTAALSVLDQKIANARVPNR
jgi:carboxyl-terminal processing protease